MVICKDCKKQLEIEEIQNYENIMKHGGYFYCKKCYQLHKWWRISEEDAKFIRDVLVSIEERHSDYHYTNITEAIHKLNSIMKD